MSFRSTFFQIVRIAGILATGILVGPMHSAQAAQIRIVDKVAVANQYASLTMGAVRCDSESNLFWIYGRRDGRMPDAVLRVAHDGKSVTTFSLVSAPHYGKSDVFNYAVASDRSVFLLTSQDGLHPAIVHFSEKGEYLSDVVLGSDVMPQQIAVFGNGNFLLTGQLSEHLADGKLAARRFRGIFDSQGKFVRELLREKPAEVDFSASVPSESARGGIAEPGPDGNIYISGFNANGRVTVVEPGGDTVRQVQLVQPRAGLSLITVKPAMYRLAALYQADKTAAGRFPVVQIALYSLSDGRKVAEYQHTDWEIGSGLACYQDDVFTFIAADKDGKIMIVHAIAAP